MPDNALTAAAAMAVADAARTERADYREFSAAGDLLV
jgi:hypothetical protein